MDYSGAFVVNPQPQTPPPQSSSPSRKSLLIKVGGLLFAVALISIGFFAYKKFIEPKTHKQRVIKKGAIGDTLFKDSHSPLFYVTLEYRPNEKIVKKLDSGVLRGDKTALFSNKPTVSADTFAYRIEVTDTNGKLLQNSWESASRNLLEVAPGILRFRAIVTNSPGAFVKIYLADNTILWSDKIQ